MWGQIRKAVQQTGIFHGKPVITTRIDQETGGPQPSGPIFGQPLWAAAQVTARAGEVITCTWYRGDELLWHEQQTLTHDCRGRWVKFGLRLGEEYLFWPDGLYTVAFSARGKQVVTARRISLAQWLTYHARNRAHKQ